MSDIQSEYDQQIDSTAWQHLGYYVRREEGQLVLIESFLVQDPADPASADVTMLHLDLDELEPEWVEAVALQGADLEEGKSCEFVTPDEDLFEFEEDLD
jgi:hypothetical protein